MMRLLLLGAASLWAAAPVDFSRTVYPVFEKANCRGCHTHDGVASATRVLFPAEGATPGQIEAFGRRLAAVVDRGDPAASLLLRKPTNRIAHTGGERIRPGSDEEKAIAAWVVHLARIQADPSAPRSMSHVAHGVRRLTHAQYDNTVRDLLGDQTRPALQFPPEDFIGGFKTHAQTIPPLLAESYMSAASRLARNAVRFGTNAIPRCQTGEAHCEERFVREFGLRAFRTPLSEEEQAAYVALLRKSPLLVIEAMLGSPSFLLRTKSGPAGFRAASFLSYTLWDTMPDGELFRAAGAGELDTTAGIEKQARRMLADPRARAAAGEFTAQWLRFDRLAASVKDRRIYPEFSAPLADAMAEETRRLVQHLVWDNRSFMEIFSADFTFVNAELARLYQLPAPSAPFARVAYPSDSERAGVLGHGLFLAQTGKPEETSPTERGLFVREHFLCQQVPPPPPGINSTLPSFLIGAKPMTNRERLTTLHLANPTCAGCHNLVDPIGFGLERFDTVGRWSAKQRLTVFPTKDQRRNVKPEYHELDLDTSASVAGIPDSAFTTARQLGRILAANPTCQKCVVRNWFRYTMGRQETDADQSLIDAVFQDFRRSGFRFQEMMVSMATRSIQ